MPSAHSVGARVHAHVFFFLLGRLWGEVSTTQLEKSFSFQTSPAEARCTVEGRRGRHLQTWSCLEPKNMCGSLQTQSNGEQLEIREGICECTAPSCSTTLIQCVKFNVSLAEYQDLLNCFFFCCGSAVSPSRWTDCTFNVPKPLSGGCRHTASTLSDLKSANAHQKQRRTMR